MIDTSFALPVKKKKKLKPKKFFTTERKIVKNIEKQSYNSVHNNEFGGWPITDIEHTREISCSVA